MSNLSSDRVLDDGVLVQLSLLLLDADLGRLATVEDIWKKYCPHV